MEHRSRSVMNLGPYRFWAYAATFGALWGAVEITAGAFLHAVKLPLAGLLLSATGAALLVSLRALLPSRGVVVAAGIVCAGLKLLSPAGAVIGPMAAILAESLLVELATTPAGANPVSGAAAGAMATLWTVAQKLITQALFYGMPVIGLYQGIARQAELTLGLPASGGATIVALFLCMAAVLGAAFGVMGARVGASTSRQIAMEPS